MHRSTIKSTSVPTYRTFLTVDLSYHAHVFQLATSGKYDPELFNVFVPLLLILRISSAAPYAPFSAASRASLVWNSSAHFLLAPDPTSL
jgi:hypothetical protein